MLEAKLETKNKKCLVDLLRRHWRDVHIKLGGYHILSRGRRRMFYDPQRDKVIKTYSIGAHREVYDIREVNEILVACENYPIGGRIVI